MIVRVSRSAVQVLLAWFICCFVSSSAFALPSGRVYEMVSPVYKGGYGVTNLHAAAPNGESVAFVSLGGFAGVLSASGQGANEYIAHRSSSGWATESLQPPFGSWTDVSQSLEYALANGPVGPNAGFENYAGTEDEFLLHPTDESEAPQNWNVIGNTVLQRLDKGPLLPIEEGASADLCHVVIGRAEGPLIPGAVGTNNQIYDLTNGCNGEPSLSLIGLNNTGTVINRYCEVELGIGSGYSPATVGKEQESNFNAVAADGGEMFFTTNVNQAEEGHCSSGVHQLFVRLGGARTLEISKPLVECTEVPCAGAAKRASAYFKGASENGERVFFTTTQSLVGEDEDQSNDLYMATIGCPVGEGQECEPAQREMLNLVQVSHESVSGEKAEVQGVTKISSDGSRVYFVARGVMGEGPGVEGKLPLKGADNLYVYDSISGKTEFIADLCSGAELSGVVKDPSCPRDLGEGSTAINDLGLFGSFPEAQTAGPDGRFLVFSTYAQLLANDTDNAKDVYRYDAENDELVRVSVGEEGGDANGNDSAFDATIATGHMGGSAKVYLQYEMGTHAISEDGTRIVFTTAAPLSADATNGLVNVYEWHEGNVSLISSGNAEEADRDPVISPSGDDIFFITDQGLVSQDTDGARDIYDARINGGFMPTLAERQPCSGDACQGGLSAPAPLLVPGSVTQAPGENLPPPKKQTPKKKATSKKKASKKKPGKRKAKAKRARHKGRRTTQGRGL